MEANKMPQNNILQSHKIILKQIATKVPIQLSKQNLHCDNSKRKELFKVLDTASSLLCKKLSLYRIDISQNINK